jgi:NADH-quinone oxidoreductase subunit B
LLQGILKLQEKIAGENITSRYEPSATALTRGLVNPR